VIRSCLETLENMRLKDFVQDVTFLAGATQKFNENDESSQQMYNVLDSVVSGHIKNVFTKNDQVLKLF